eukprot:GHVP01030802.1.p1 GENE.GHVP01030802.1~~GHVP01030802.1.p1  ORF type:complete len:296 (-),score=40.92 GHVP01030802.1:70-957(-)
MINIKRTEDAHYRYKMPELQTKTEGRGNGIKTVLVNIEEVSKALNRPVSYPIRYFGTELGTLSVCDTNKQKYYINGQHTSSELLNILYCFIDKYVICKSCDNPETEINNDKKTDKLYLICSACGCQTLIDNNHKLSIYILKNINSTKINEDKIIKNKYSLYIDRINENKYNHNINKIINELNIRNDRALGIYIQILIENNNELDGFVKGLNLIRNNIKNDYDRNSIMGGIERICSHDNSKLLLINSFLQILYNEDFLSEEYLKNWNKSYNSSYIKKSDAIKIRNEAKKFFGWLDE